MTAEADFAVTMSSDRGTRTVDRDIDGKHLAYVSVYRFRDDYPRITISPKGTRGGPVRLNVEYVPIPVLSRDVPELTITPRPGILSYVAIDLPQGADGFYKLNADGNDIYYGSSFTAGPKVKAKDLVVFADSGQELYLVPPATIAPVKVKLEPFETSTEAKGTHGLTTRTIKGTLGSVHTIDQYDIQLPTTAMQLMLTLTDAKNTAEPYCCLRLQVVSGGPERINALKVTSGSPLQRAATYVENGQPARLLVSYAGLPGSRPASLDYEIAMKIEAPNYEPVCRSNNGKGVGTTWECTQQGDRRSFTCAKEEGAGDDSRCVVIP